MDVVCMPTRHFRRDLVSQFNFTHTIHRLSFGEDYPGQVNPLDNFSAVSTEDLRTGNTYPIGGILLVMVYNILIGGVMYQYFVKVVPTVYNKLTGQVSVCMATGGLVTALFNTVRLSRQTSSPSLGIKRLLMQLLGHLDFQVCGG